MHRYRFRRDILTLEELAEYLHCHPSTIRQLVNKGRIQGLRLEEGRLLKTVEFEGWCFPAPGKPKKSGLA